MLRGGHSNYYESGGFASGDLARTTCVFDFFRVFDRLRQGVGNYSAKLQAVDL